MAGHRCASVPVLNGWRGISAWRSPPVPGDEGITTLQPRIKNGSKVEVLIGDELVITGWVEATPFVTMPVRSAPVLPDVV